MRLLWLLFLSTAAYAAPPKPQYLYFPGKDALVVYFHGGAWVAGEKEAFEPIGRAFAAKGLAAAIVDYRLSSVTGVQHPAHARDGAAALKELAGKKLPMVLLGHSAGAHLAATLVTDASLGVQPLVRGVVTTEGIFDLPKLVADFPSYGDWFLNLAFGRDRTKWKLASPCYGNLQRSPPWRLVHSQGDTLVNLAQSEAMLGALEKAKVEATLDKVQGLEHDEVTDRLTVVDDPLFLRVVDFVLKAARSSERSNSSRGNPSGRPRPGS